MTDQSILNHIDEALRLDKEARATLNIPPGCGSVACRVVSLLPLLASDCASLMERVAELEKALAHNVLLMGLAESEANKDRITAADELAEVTRQRNESDSVIANWNLVKPFESEDEFIIREDYRLAAVARHRAKQQPGETR